MKRDINLLPKKKASSNSSKGIVITLSVLLIYILVFGVAIKIPLDLVSAVEVYNNDLDTQMVSLQPQVAEYDNLVAELAQLQDEINNTEQIEYSDRTFYNSLKIIQETCPTGIIILNFKNTNEVIEFTAKAETDEQVAQFLLELDRTNEFSSIQFSGTVPSDVVRYNEYGEPYNEEARQFNASMIYVSKQEKEAAQQESESVQQ